MHKNKLKKIVGISNLITDMSLRNATEGELTKVVDYLIAVIDEESDELETFEDLKYLRDKYLNK